VTATLNCPKCGGDNTYAGGAEAVHCQYCGTLVPLPDELRAAQNVEQLRVAGGTAARWVVLILIITVGVPACLGIVGALLGIGASLLGIVVSIAAPILALILQAVFGG
jgi:hypothetical protein